MRFTADTEDRPGAHAPEGAGRCPHGGPRARLAWTARLASVAKGARLAPFARVARGVRRARSAAACAAPVLAFVCASTCAPACANNDANQVSPPVVLGMTSAIAPYYSDGQLTIYEVQTPVTLPMRRATDAEAKALSGKAPEPYPRNPFLVASDFRIEIRFTLSNLDDAPHDVELLVDPWNEFVRYRPGVTVVSDERTIPNFSGYDRFFVVPAKGRVQGTITPDDTNELAVDLATAENVLAHPPQGLDVSLGELVNHIFNLQNRSNGGDALVAPFIPKTIAGLTGFDLGVRTYEPATVAVEIVVDTTDLDGGRLVPAGSSEKPIGEPGTVLSPPANGAGM